MIKFNYILFILGEPIMGVDQTVRVGYGFVVPENEIDNFLNQLINIKFNGAGRRYKNVERQQLIDYHKSKNSNFDPNVIAPYNEIEEREKHEEGLEDFLFNPWIEFVNTDPSWLRIHLDLHYNESLKARTLIVYDSTWSESVTSKYETVAPVKLNNNQDYDGVLFDLLDELNEKSYHLGWVFYAYTW
jgi:hypothetical protein